MSNLARFTSPLVDWDTFCIADDFKDDQSDLFWIDTITDSGTALVGDAANGIMQLLPSDGTVADNDAYLRDTNGYVIVHRLAIASSTEMQAFFGMKNGDITNVETLNIDAVVAVQTR